MRSERTAHGLIVVLTMLLTVLGCAGKRPHATGHPARIAAAPYLLFNPDPEAFPIVEYGRSDWPATSSFNELGEVVEYQETIIDRQGRFGIDQDLHYRRFDSVRTGRAYR
ncbi:MAG: hypothetical protein HY763_08820 [Planctomycetes bacterium]|nr:hypothetical protein [Planctomycetota bacterium]